MRSRLAFSIVSCSLFLSVALLTVCAVNSLANDTLETADDINVDSTYVYKIDPVDDQDWLRIEIQTAGLFEVWSEGGLDLYVNLYDSNDELVDGNDDSGQDLNFSLEIALSAGTYYIQVRSLFGGTGEYTLKTRHVPGGHLPQADDPEDPNGSWEKAADFALNSADDNWQINPVEDVDWLRVEVVDIGFLEIYSRSTVDTYALLTNSDQEILISDDDSGYSLDFRIGFYVDPGIYYVAIQGYSTGQYTVHVEFTPGPRNPRDVNYDGVIDVNDLILVASNFGKETSSGDVNDDGIVDREDISLVLDALEANEADSTPGAPLFENKSPITERLKQWINYANRDDAIVLEQLLETLLSQEVAPSETALLANYPNPFNPETWIPYRLSVPTDVTITIYTANGRVVRTLAIGYQLPGIYETQQRAAYWDGRNSLGEPVASGVYFYSLTAGDFIATRKMLIQK